MKQPVPYILLVEDDQSLGYLLREYLIIKGFEVLWLADGREVLSYVAQRIPDLCMLDVMMPTVDGFQVASALREAYPALPFIFLTAKSMKVDVLRGFHLGADDYIKKPVEEEELIARIQAVLRRSQKQEVVAPTHIAIGQYEFHPTKQELVWKGQTQKLSRRESDLLQLLCEQLGQVVPASHLLMTLWGKDDYFARKSMDVYLHKLRKHLLHDDTIQILNVHGRGFYLEIKSRV